MTPEAAHGRLDELSRVYASAFTPAGQGIPGSLPETSFEKTGALGVSGAGRQQAAADGDLAGNPLLALVRTGIENDFEEVVFQQQPSLRAIKQALVGENGGLENGGALCAMRSGSGSSIFGLFCSAEEADAAEQRVQELGTGARTFETRTVNRESYWRTMFEQ